MTLRSIKAGRTYRGEDGHRRRVLTVVRCGNMHRRGLGYVTFRSAMTTGGMHLGKFAAWAASDVTRADPLAPLVRTTYLTRLPDELRAPAVAAA